MTNETTFGEIDGREWLTCRHNGKERRFAFPPVWGGYSNCYLAIKADNSNFYHSPESDSEIVPACGLDLALLAQGAYTQDTSRWARVRGCFASRVNAPMRGLWIPHRRNLAGVYWEKDFKGEGFATDVRLPKDISDWRKGDNGIYVSSDGSKIFVPEESIKLGEHTKDSFAKDGFATAVLTAEGAEIFARTAFDTNGTLWTDGFGVKEITVPMQVTANLYEFGGQLGIEGCNNVYDAHEGYAFGVQRTSEA